MNNLPRVVLDTNAVLSSVSRRSPYRPILQKLFEGKYELFITNDILLEYEEKIGQNFDAETAELNIGAMLLLPNLRKIDTYFHLKLIYPDLDDNKFADCAFAANAHYLVTNDRHFNIREIQKLEIGNCKALKTNVSKNFQFLNFLISERVYSQIAAVSKV